MKKITALSLLLSFFFSLTAFSIPSTENDSVSLSEREGNMLFEKPKSKSKQKKGRSRLAKKLGIRKLSKNERRIFKAPNKFNKKHKHRAGKKRFKFQRKNKHTAHKAGIFKKKKNNSKLKKKNFYNKDRH